MQPDGKFDLTNLPPESISVRAQVKGYRHSGRNKSLDRLNPFGLAGRLDQDKTNFVMLLEPGEMLPSEWNSAPPDERAENLPLSGIEDGGWNEKIVSGRILDEQTGQPIAGTARVFPGFSRGFKNGYIDWQNSRGVVAEEGKYEISVSPRTERMLIKVLADGYAAHVSTNLTLSSTNLRYDITMTPAEDISATLLGLDGKPAVGVKVCIIGAGEQGHFNRKGELRLYQVGEEAYAVTDPEGRFKFAPRPGEADIYAATDKGFVHASANNLPEKIALQPYGRVRGRLVRNGKPVAEEEVDLAMQRQFSMLSPHLNLHGTLTDQDGNFLIENVPPGNLQLTRREGMDGGGGWSNVEIKKFETQPGELIDFGDLQYPESRITRR